MSTVIIVGGGGHLNKSFAPIPAGTTSLQIMFAINDLSSLRSPPAPTKSYASSNAAIATVDSAGVVTIHGAGRVTITATATRGAFTHTEEVELGIAGTTDDFYTGASVIL